MVVLKKYIFYSAVFHIFFVIFTTIIGFLIHKNHKEFIVFGAHSFKPNSVRYKSFKTAIPFVKENLSKRFKKKTLTQATSNKKNVTSNQKKDKKTNEIKTKNIISKKNIPHKNELSKKTTPKNIIQKKVLEKKSNILQTEHHENISTNIQDESNKIVIAEKKFLEKKIHKQNTSTKDPSPKKYKQKINNQIATNDQNTDEYVESTTIDKIDHQSKIDDQLTDQDLNIHNFSEKDSTNEEDSVFEFNFVGNNDSNVKVYQKHIQTEVERLWHPPVGVPKGTICSILFTVNAQGVINKCEFVQRSKMLIYDLSIMRVAKSFKFNKCLWNKQFKIDFRQ